MPGRMLGKHLRGFCPKCRTMPGQDCPDRAAPSRKTVRSREKAILRQEIQRAVSDRKDSDRGPPDA